MVMHSMFSQVDLFLNQKQTSTLGVNYPYKVMMDTIFNTTKRETDSRMQTEGFSMDSASANNDPVEGFNTGLIRCYHYTGASQTAEFRGPLYVDLQQQDQYILNEVEVKLSLWPGKSAFALMAHGEETPFKLEVVDVLSYAKLVSVLPSSPGIRRPCKSLRLSIHSKRVRSKLWSYPLVNQVLIWKISFPEMCPEFGR